MEIDTVDAFEGREKDIVIVSLVRSNRRRDIGFLRLMQRINVALSRARRLLVVVGDASTLRGSYFDRIIRYTRANGMIVPGPRLIGRLLNARTGARAPAPTRGRRSLPRMGTLRSDLFPPRPIEGRPHDGRPLDGRPLDGRPLDNRLSGPVPPDADRAGRRRRRGRRRPDRDARGTTSPQMPPRIVPELPLQGPYRAPVGDEPEPMSGIQDTNPWGGGSPSEPAADDASAPASAPPAIVPEHGSVNGTTPTPESPAPRRRTRTRRPPVGEAAAAAPAAEVVAPAPEVVVPAAEPAVPVGEVAVPSGESGDVPAARPTRRRRTTVTATVSESLPVDVGAPERPPADAPAPARSRHPRRVAQVDAPAPLPSPAPSVPPASSASDDVPVKRARTTRRARPTEGVAEAQDGPSTTELEPVTPRPRRTRRATREAPPAETAAE